MTDWRDFEAVLAGVVKAGLEEDAVAGDAATAALPRGGSLARRAVLAARSRMVMCGWRAVEEVFRAMGSPVGIERSVPDGSEAPPGAVLGVLSGRADALLGGERLLLNLVSRLSGIATSTRELVALVEGTGVEVLDTRKTTPGMRALERYAVRCGGGVNHRFDLASMAMFKDNHWTAAGGIRGISEAVRTAREAGLAVEIEIDSADLLRPVMDLHPQRILLDNMSPAAVGAAAAAATGSGIYLEASGGIRPSNARAYAETGVDGISAGWITHSAPAADVALDWEA
jgi:nicotinate-nucleotide pyrophosphorylase (carboxylating)